MTLRKLGAASARELAEEMGRTPEVLHYHMKALLAADLVREKLRRPTSRKPEAVYEPTATRYNLPNLGKEPELASITRRAISAGLRDTIRRYESASRKAEIDQNLRQFMQVIRAGVRLSPDDAKEFMRMIEAASRFAQEHEAKDGVRVLWSSIVFPEVRE